MVVIRVKDSGTGITPDLLPHVFDLFEQADRSLDRSAGGLGIGLTLVKRLVALHGGRVEAHSAGPGRGAEFVVRLPAGVSHEIEPKTSLEERPQAPALKVLVVDDNADMAESLARLLSMTGYQVRVAASGPAALEVATEFLPDAIILDIGLPQMDGYEVARRLRAAPAMAGVRLIALTGYGRTQDRRHAEAAGFDHHLVKPVEFARLQELLASVATSQP